MIWRVYIFYSRGNERWILLVPLTLLAGSFGTFGSEYIYTESTYPGDSDFWVCLSLCSSSHGTSSRWCFRHTLLQERSVFFTLHNSSDHGCCNTPYIVQSLVSTSLGYIPKLQLICSGNITATCRVSYG